MSGRGYSSKSQRLFETALILVVRPIRETDALRSSLGLLQKTVQSDPKHPLSDLLENAPDPQGRHDHHL